MTDLLSTGEVLQNIDTFIDLCQNTRDQYDAAQTDPTYAVEMIKSVESSSRISIRESWNKLSKSVNKLLGEIV